MEIPFDYGIEEHISLLSFLLPGHHEVLNKYAILCINYFLPLNTIQNNKSVYAGLKL